MGRVYQTRRQSPRSFLLTAELDIVRPLSETLAMLVVVIPVVYVLLLFYALRDWRALLAWGLLWATSALALRLGFNRTSSLRTARRAQERLQASGIEPGTPAAQAILDQEIFRPEPRRTVHILFRGALTAIVYLQPWSIPIAAPLRYAAFTSVFVLHALDFSDAFRSWLGCILMPGDPDVRKQRWVFLSMYGGFWRRLLITPIGIIAGSLASPLFSFLAVFTSR